VEDVVDVETQPGALVRRSSAGDRAEARLGFSRRTRAGARWRRGVGEPGEEAATELCRLMAATAEIGGGNVAGGGACA
jgi:hypothetical protein